MNLKRRTGALTNQSNSQIGALSPLWVKSRHVQLKDWQIWSNEHVADFLRSTLLSELHAAQQHIISVGAKDRFLAFLRNWRKQSGGTGLVHLSIGYQDIADYLGIKIETLSRVIIKLERSGVLTRSSSRGLLFLRKPRSMF